MFTSPLLIGFIATAFLADGYTDRYYLRLTSPQQNALIIGSSRAGQGLLPSVLNPALAHEYPQPLYNFAFSSLFSPFGETYLNAIRKKLNNEIKNSLFIVSVDPWCLAAAKQDPEDSSLFQERQCMLGNNPWINTNPCFTYFIKDYPMPYLTLFTGKLHRDFFHFRPDFRLHENGWLEISCGMDSLTVKDRSAATLFRLVHDMNQKTISNTRLSYLTKTIRFLQQHGDVYVVRMPVHPNTLAVENKLCPVFNRIIDSLTRQCRVPYFNFTDSCSKYTYVDGSHLWKESGALLSKELSQLIINYRHSR